MITKQMIKAIAPNSKDEIVDPLVKFLNIHMPKYEVNTYLRVTHFLAQAAHEAASFRTLEEYASGAAYEGRKDLGNVVRGDGVRYKGRGIFQLTGRANYTQCSRDLFGDDTLANDPDLVRTPEYAIITACWFWYKNKLNEICDRGDIVLLSKRINGGTIGLEDRIKHWNDALDVFEG
jgi:putative chitinase